MSPKRSPILVVAALILLLLVAASVLRYPWHLSSDRILAASSTSSFSPSDDADGSPVHRGSDSNRVPHDEDDVVPFHQVLRMSELCNVPTPQQWIPLADDSDFDDDSAGKHTRSAVHHWLIGWVPFTHAVAECGWMHGTDASTADDDDAAAARCRCTMRFPGKRMDDVEAVEVLAASFGGRIVDERGVVVMMVPRGHSNTTHLPRVDPWLCDGPRAAPNRWMMSGAFRNRRRLEFRVHRRNALRNFLGPDELAGNRAVGFMVPQGCGWPGHCLTEALYIIGRLVSFFLTSMSAHVHDNHRKKTEEASPAYSTAHSPLTLIVPDVADVQEEVFRVWNHNEEFERSISSSPSTTRRARQSVNATFFYQFVGKMLEFLSDLSAWSTSHFHHRKRTPAVSVVKIPLARDVYHLHYTTTTRSSGVATPTTRTNHNKMLRILAPTMTHSFYLLCHVCIEVGRLFVSTMVALDSSPRRFSVAGISSQNGWPRRVVLLKTQRHDSYTHRYFVVTPRMRRMLENPAFGGAVVLQDNISWFLRAHYVNHAEVLIDSSGANMDINTLLLFPWRTRGVVLRRRVTVVHPNSEISIQFRELREVEGGASWWCVNTQLESLSGVSRTATTATTWSKIQSLRTIFDVSPAETKCDAFQEIRSSSSRSRKAVDAGAMEDSASPWWFYCAHHQNTSSLEQEIPFHVLFDV